MRLDDMYHRTPKVPKKQLKESTPVENEPHCVPHFSANSKKHSAYLDHLKHNNPALYNRMKNWD